MQNPILVELTRGNLVESIHTGALAICDPKGRIITSTGNIDRPIYPRSAVKVFQALPVLESGTADRYIYGSSEIALLCASHSGTPVHATLAQDMLTRAGQSEPALACGPHHPMNDDDARELYKSGQTPSRLHNNCSGKHAGMLATCVHCGDPTTNYCDLDHPHQRRIAKALHDFTGYDTANAYVGIDGCSAPNWAFPLRHLAHAFARFITRDGLAKDRARHCETIVNACMAEPLLVAGSERLDTRAMTALSGKLYIKTGAEGIYCGAFPEMGYGFALKIDDGNKRASEAITTTLISRILGTSQTFGTTGTITNWHGTTTGETRTTVALSKTLDAIRSTTH
ncbi:MAG: asparaginase [Hyphomicrobiaceae bacterium]|nr:asparaginase [Hyphomicrobiaceae bacterium]